MNATPRSVRSGLVRLVVIAGGAGFLAVSASGCYQQVVGARGFGADSVGVAKPNLENPSGGERVLGYKKYTPRPMPGGG